MEKNQKKSFIASTLVTLVIVVMLILSGPVSAVTVSISGLSGSITKGDLKTFYINVTIENTDQYVPISNITLNITGATTIQCTFYSNGTTISCDPAISSVSLDSSSSTNVSNYGYGYGYGYEAGYGYHYFGYGYGYGYSGSTTSFSYKITLSTANLPTGSYTATASLNAEGPLKSATFTSSSASFTIVAPSAGAPSAGGVGGGVVTSEPFDNIAVYDRNERNLIANTPVTYSFTKPKLGVYEVVVTGKENEYNIAIRVEALKGTSKLVSYAPPGVVYKNINIWAGTKRIKEALIRFKVKNSWITSNNLAATDIKMVKWDGSKWVQLETTQKAKDDTYTYYEAKTSTLSIFAITGLKGGVMPTATPAGPSVTPAVTTPAPTKTPTATPTKKKWIPGFEATIAIAGITLAVLLSLIRGRRR